MTLITNVLEPGAPVGSIRVVSTVGHKIANSKPLAFQNGRASAAELIDPAVSKLSVRWLPEPLGFETRRGTWCTGFSVSGLSRQEGHGRSGL